MCRAFSGKLSFIAAALLLNSGVMAWPGYNRNGAVIHPRLSVVDWTNYNYHEPEGPGTYAFGYDIEDPATNNVQFRNEERHPNGTVTGSYGYVEPDGNVRIVRYVADHNGYRAEEENSVKLTMLKPVRVPGSPFSEIGLTDSRRRLPSNNQNFFQQIDNAYQSDLYESNSFEQYEPQYIKREPGRIFLKKPYFYP